MVGALFQKIRNCKTIHRLWLRRVMNVMRHYSMNKCIENLRITWELKLWGLKWEAVINVNILFATQHQNASHCFVIGDHDLSLYVKTSSRGFYHAARNRFWAFGLGHLRFSRRINFKNEEYCPTDTQPQPDPVKTWKACPKVGHY